MIESRNHPFSALASVVATAIAKSKQLELADYRKLGLPNNELLHRVRRKYYLQSPSAYFPKPWSINVKMAIVGFIMQNCIVACAQSVHMSRVSGRPRQKTALYSPVCRIGETQSCNSGFWGNKCLPANLTWKWMQCIGQVAHADKDKASPTLLAFLEFQPWYCFLLQCIRNRDRENCRWRTLQRRPKLMKQNGETIQNEVVHPAATLSITLKLINKS